MISQPGSTLRKCAFVAAFLVIVLVVILILILMGAAFHSYKSRPDVQSTILNRDAEGVKKMIAAGWDVRTRFKPGLGNRGYTALHVACGQCFPEICRILIEAGADIDAID